MVQMQTIILHRTTMMKFMLNDLILTCKDKKEPDGSMVDKLVQGAKTKQYVPLMKRKKCGKKLHTKLVQG